MTAKPVYYMASPYTAYPEGIEEAFHLACAVAGAFIQRGMIVFSPIAHSHPLVELGGVENTHEVWMEQDLHILAKCDALLAIKAPGWENSKGMKMEIEEAGRLGIPVIYYDLEETTNG